MLGRRRLRFATAGAILANVDVSGETRLRRIVPLELKRRRNGSAEFELPIRSCGQKSIRTRVPAESAGRSFSGKEMQRFMHSHNQPAPAKRGNSVLVALLLCGAAGCMNPWNTRLPIAQPANPRSEAVSFQQQDPFPDPDIAPSMGTRPLGYDRPRTQPRQAAEQRIFHGLQSGPEYSPGGEPRGGLRRPQAAR